MMDKKQILIIGCSILLAVSLYNLTQTQSTLLQKANLKSYISWEDWVVKYKKDYLTPEEAKFRLKNFNENLEYIAYKNTKMTNTFKYGVNKFADLTNEEFKNLYINKHENFYKTLTKKFNSNGGKINQTLGTNKKFSSMNWRDTGCIKNDSIDRKGCPGASYAITAVEALSSTICANKGYFSIKFSAQEIIDCSKANGNNGCESGFSGYAFDYIKTFGICADNNYPYTGIEGKCDEAKCWQKTNMKGWEIFKMIDGQSLESLLNQHPVIALIDASHLRLYDSGIYNGYCTTNFNSHVLVVGYGASNGSKYWILKNSWGGDWGEEGYFRIERLNSGKGKCGILTLIESVVV